MRRLFATSITFLFFLTLGTTAWAQQDIDLGLITVKSKAEAEQIRDKIMKGASFESLAKTSSVGPAAFKGGRLGLVPRKRLRTEYRKALQGLPPNRPSYVIPTEEGYTILMYFADQPKLKTAQAEKPAPVRTAAAPPARRSRPAPSSAKVPDIPYLAARTLVAAGVEQLSRGEFKEAGENFDKALKENPYADSAKFFKELLAGLKGGKNEKKAVETFATGFVFMLEGDIDRAHKLFAQAANMDNGFWQAGLFEANMLADLGRPKDAQKKLAALVAKHPKASRAYVTMGLIAAEEGKIEEAEGLFAKAADINPELADAHYQISTLAILKDDYKTAEKRLLATIKADPYREEAYNDLGLVMMYTKRYDQAEKYYQKALEIDSNFAPALMNLGQLYGMQKKLNKAADEFNKALLVDPKLGSAHSNLATAYVLMGKWEQAQIHADAAKELKFPVPESVTKALQEHLKKATPAK